MLRRTYQLDGEPTPGQAAAPPPQARDLAGFDDETKLAQAYRASSAEARRLKERADQLESQWTQFMQRQQQPQSQDPYQRLRDEGWPVETLRDVIEQVAERKAVERFTPIARGLEARGKVLSEYPDYSKYEADVARWLEEDSGRQQRYNAMFQSDPVGAMDWAFLKFGEQARRSQGPSTNGADAASRTDAQIPSSRTDGTRQRGGDDQGEETTRRAYAEFKKTGDPAAREAFIRARLKKAIPDDFFSR